MILATDLDRTLIYSERFLETVKTSYQQIEIYQDRPISYISLKALMLLDKLARCAHIVPVTTRSLEQYHRIEVFKGNRKPEIYVVNNGGTIYYQGKEDEAWSNQIKAQIKAMPVGYEEALAAFLSQYKGPVERYKKSDDLIWLVLGDASHIDFEAVKVFEKQYAESGWRIDVNGRKIYLYPHFINKWAAVRYIKEHYWQEEVIAAGDSLFDYEMVHRADYGIVPKEAWIEKQCGQEVRITQKPGLEAAEEILAFALEKALEKAMVL